MFILSICAKFTSDFLKSVLQIFPDASELVHLLHCLPQWGTSEWETVCAHSNEALVLLTAGQFDEVMQLSQWGLLQRTSLRSYYARISPATRAAFWDTLVPVLRVHCGYTLLPREFWTQTVQLFERYPLPVDANLRDWKSTVLHFIRNPEFLQSVIAYLPAPCDLNALLPRSLPLVQSFNLPLYVPVVESDVVMSKSARRKARRASQIQARRKAASNQYTPFISEFEKIVQDGIEETDLADVLESVSCLLEEVRSENRQLSLSDLWRVIEKIYRDEPCPAEFKEMIEVLQFVDLSNPQTVLQQFSAIFSGGDPVQKRDFQNKMSDLQSVLFTSLQGQPVDVSNVLSMLGRVMD